LQINKSAFRSTDVHYLNMEYAETAKYIKESGSDEYMGSMPRLSHDIN